jgi:hypothetical protein
MSEGTKNIHLRSPTSMETINAIASETFPASAQVEAPPAEPRIGAIMPDGTIYAGISPNTGNPMYTTPTDEGFVMTWDKADELARNKEAHGHNDWDLATPEELNVLFKNRLLIGGFNENGTYPAGWYWSSAAGSQSGVRVQRFSDGCQGRNWKRYYSSVRCVR